jgi:hypothetical protein
MHFQFEQALQYIIEYLGPGNDQVPAIMTRVLTFQTEAGNRINVAVENDDRGVVQSQAFATGEGYVAKGGLSDLRFSDMFDDLRVYTDALARKLDEIAVKPTEIEVSIGVTIKTEGGLVFLKAGGEADMNIKLTWKNEPPAAIASKT